MAAPLTLDEDMMLALLGLPEGGWWNIASDAAGTRSLARRVGCTQERLSAFVKHNKLRGRSMLGTMRKTLTVGEQTLTVFRSDQTSGCGLREHKLRHNHWWSFGTQPAHPAKWFLDNKPDGVRLKYLFPQMLGQEIRGHRRLKFTIKRAEYFALQKTIERMYGPGED